MFNIQTAIRLIHLILGISKEFNNFYQIPHQIEVRYFTTPLYYEGLLIRFDGEFLFVPHEPTLYSDFARNKEFTLELRYFKSVTAIIPYLLIHIFHLIRQIQECDSPLKMNKSAFIYGIPSINASYKKTIMNAIRISSIFLLSCCIWAYS